MEKYITFSVPIKKEVINNNGHKKIITYKVKFIDRFRFMSTSLSELVVTSWELVVHAQKITDVKYVKK